MPQSSFFWGEVSEVGTYLSWNMKEFFALKLQSYVLVVWGKKKKPTQKRCHPPPPFFFIAILPWVNFKWLFVRKLLLFQTRVHLSAFTGIKSTPKGKQNSPTLFLSAWNLQ